ncbi:MAG: 1-acyl-sn-glycerol-3-phosphate acyltransferase [Candidatus Marinimicrobia bacterium]|nr:1-acyl-sn-glycerol-3-phosphate acyltransferase [Candidatus Neomarinimicrobiota bacterium]
MRSILKNISSSIIALVIWPFALITFVISAGTYLFVALFISPKRLHPLARFLCRFMLLGAGQIIKIKGEIPDPKDGPHLYLFNHQSLLDQFLIAGTIKEYISAVGADYQFSWPIWGRLIKRYGAIPIVRKDLSKAIYSLKLAEDEIRKGTSFLISPEGTRTLTGKMGEFKKGPFHLSLNTGITIIPIGLIGAYDSKQKNDWRIYPGMVTVRIGKPVKKEYYQKMSVDELRDVIRNKISLLCDDDSIVDLDIQL